MQLTKEAYDFSQLILSRFRSLDSKQTQKQQESLQPEQISDPLIKYSNDYSKFNKLSIDEQQQTLNKDIKENPLIPQYGCQRDRRKERELFEMPTQQKLDNAVYFKNEGNNAIKDNEYDKAAYFYAKALLQFDYTFPETKDEEYQLQQLKEQCHSNMSLVKFKQQNYQESIKHIIQVLNSNPNNIKALYRKASISLILDKYEECQKDIDQIFKLEETHQEAKKLQNQLHLKIKEYKLKEKTVIKQMFSV